MASKSTSLRSRELAALCPQKGIGEATGTTAVSPGTSVTLSSLGVINLKVLTLTPTAANETVYTIRIRLPDGRFFLGTFTSDETATVAEITAGLVNDINAKMPANTVLATDITTALTLTSEIQGGDFAVDIISGTVAVSTSTPPNIPDFPMVKVFLCSEAGTGIMYLEQGGDKILACPPGAVAFEWINPFNGDLAVVGNGTDIFTVFVTQPDVSQFPI